MLEVERAGRVESVECATRSYLRHDFLHLAVEGAARLTTGFWGRLDAGWSIEQAMTHREGLAGVEDLLEVERIVGALHGLARGRSAEAVMLALRGYAAALDQPLPGWLDARVVERALDRLVALEGRWRATPFGDAMVVNWPEGRDPDDASSPGVSRTL